MLLANQVADAKRPPDLPMSLSLLCVLSRIPEECSSRGRHLPALPEVTVPVPRVLTHRSAGFAKLPGPLWCALELGQQLCVQGGSPWTGTRRPLGSAGEPSSSLRAPLSWVRRWGVSYPRVRRHSAIQSGAVSCNLARAAIRVALTRTVIINYTPRTRRRSCTPA